MTTHTTAEDLQDNGPKLLAIILTLRIVSFLVVCLRMWSRVFIVKRLSAGDWCMVAATIASIFLSVVSGIGIRYGTGRHVWVLPASYQVKANRLLYIDQVLYPATLGLTKSSILLFYLELSPQKTFIRMVNWTQMVIIAMTISLTFAFAFQCTPTGYTYDPEAYPNGHCVNKVLLNYTAAALNIVTDVWVLCIPIPMFLRLKCATRQKVILIILFSLGGLTCIASVIRLKTLYALSTGIDKTWILYEVVTWSAFETSIGIMTASIPFTKALIDHYSPRLLSGLSISFNMPTQQRSRLDNDPSINDVFSSTRRGDKGDDINSEHALCPIETFERPASSPSDAKEPASEAKDCELGAVYSRNW